MSVTTAPLATCAPRGAMGSADGEPDDGRDCGAEDWTGTSAGCWLMAPFFRAKGWSGASERAVGEGSLPLGRAALPGGVTERFIA